MNKKLRIAEPEKPVDVGFDDYGYKKNFYIDKSRKVSVLITGAGSYIGESFISYCESHYPNISIETLDMKDSGWRNYDFKDNDGRPYNCVFHVAGIAHADVGHVTPSQKEQYYKVNCCLAIETAKVAKAAGVGQFIYISSMIVYGNQKYIGIDTIPAPANFYGDSKWRGDIGVRRLCSEKFAVAVLRLPMIYGRDSKGNYPTLSGIAKVVPLFPAVNNKRSMLYIGNLCEFVSMLACSGSGGVFFPQNSEYSNTSSLVELIAQAKNKKIHLSKALNLVVEVLKGVPEIGPLGKVRGLSRKAFGNFYYDMKLSIYNGLEYQKVGLEESIRRIEG